MVTKSDNEWTPERIREIEARWKSDVDLKLDKVLEFIEENEAFLKMLIEREAARQRLRHAVIEKTLSALIWAGIVGLMVLVWNGTKAEISMAVDAMKGPR